MPDPSPSPIHAPELTGAVAWLNVPAPLTLAALRGKVVLLDFWTYGCINCIHVLRDLERLERRFARELVVIGVHAAKFSNEQATENIRQIIHRYGITHPVANDAEFRIWRAYTVRAWPTRVIIDPAGYIVGAASGEGNYEGFEEAIEAVIRVFDERGELSRAAIALAPEAVATSAGTLAFPGKVLARDGRLYISDSNHHQVVVADTTGRIVDRIGSGAPGMADGTFDEAAFSRPQGLALAGRRLLVADTGNHLVRAVDLDRRSVTTIAGTGERCMWREEGGVALKTALSSPWDLAVHGELLFIAMAGLHQVWMLDVARGVVWPYAGSGAEARVDGGIEEAAFAQPSGLDILGGTMLVADAESNIVRAIELPPVNRVATLAGGNLFDFGDRDGRGDEVRLQHPLGIACDPVGQGRRPRVYVADTYNHRIKALDPATRAVSVVAGTGRPGHDDGPVARASFYEPGGLSLMDGVVYVADTNNHAIRTITLATGKVGTLPLSQSF